MNHITPFTIFRTELASPGQFRTVDFFCRLLWAEAADIGIAKHLIDVPDCINVGDGGFDAYNRVVSNFILNEAGAV